MKIEVNENLTSLINYIHDSDKEVTVKELVQFAIDYKCFKELYIYWSVIQALNEEHTKALLQHTWKKPA